ncbi:hypothetical protein KJ765_06825 [Candidatus Micrarchaeota archaeon]|nr:hypothetical protein [Candidatus Micrarchaeota archaeon]
MRILKEKGKEKSYSQYFVEMTPIAGEPFHIVEEKSLLEILKRIQSDARVKSLFEKHSEKQVVHALNAIPSIWTALQKHVRTYYWINNSYAKTPYLDEAFFVSQLKEKLSVGVDAERQLMKLMQNDRQRVIVREKALNELTISKSLQALLDLVGKIAFYQDVRKTGMLMAVYESNRLVQEIAKRFGYAHSMLLFALPRELTERQLHQPRFKTVLEQRMKRYLLVYGFNDWTIYGGNEAVRKEKELLGERRQEWDATMTNVMGTCASVGYAVGRAKIVLSSDELKKVKTGDVMVARSTRPEMVPAMKRAAAIVTDEGGITSHAAIVSRELGVPCVIATKVATRVFKDGDLLEVKANHGVINKLEG